MALSPEVVSESPGTETSITLRDMTTFHQANIDRISAIEKQVTNLRCDIDEILQWTRNAKSASNMAAKFLHSFKKVAMWGAQVVGAVTILWSAVVAIRSGRMPDINFKP